MFVSSDEPLSLAREKRELNLRVKRYREEVEPEAINLDLKGGKAQITMCCVFLSRVLTKKGTLYQELRVCLYSSASWWFKAQFLGDFFFNAKHCWDVCAYVVQQNWGNDVA